MSRRATIFSRERRRRAAAFLAVGGAVSRQAGNEENGDGWFPFSCRSIESRDNRTHRAIFLKSSQPSPLGTQPLFADYGGHESGYACGCVRVAYILATLPSEHNLTRYVWGCANLLSATSNRTVGREICSRCGWRESTWAYGGREAIVALPGERIARILIAGTIIPREMTCIINESGFDLLNQPWPCVGNALCQPSIRLPTRNLGYETYSFGAEMAKRTFFWIDNCHLNTDRMIKIQKTFKRSL